ncbi:MAG: hypothetical protein R3E77_10440 [Steroidobacteraceae bacterium]
MTAPLILSDQGDVAVFETVRDLERYVESPDIAAYSVFDTSGRRYFFKGCQDTSRDNAIFQGVNSAELDQENPGHIAQDELAAILRSYIRRVERCDPTETLSLQQLVQKTIDLCGYTK